MGCHVILCVLLVTSCVHVSYCALGSGDSVNYLPYDCQDNDCHTDGRCDFATGTCVDCDPNTHDYACRPIINDACGGCAISDATIDANTDGANFCTSAEQCACAEGLLGPDCTTKTLDVTCAADQIDITVSPHPKLNGDAFGGKIFLSTTRNINFENVDPSCQSSAADSFTAVLRTSTTGVETCNDLLGAEADTGGGLVVYVYVQQRNDIRSSADQFVRVSCMPAVNGGITGFNVESALDSREPIPSTVDSTASGMSLSLKKQEGSTWTSITDNIRVADDISVVVEHSAKFYLRECRVSNYDIEQSPNLANFRQMWLIQEWCVPSQTELLFRNIPTFVEQNTRGGQTDTTNYAWRLDLEAFYFVEGGSNELFVTCYVCDATDQANCQPDDTTILTCDNDFFVYGDMDNAITGARRKRSVVEAGLGTLNSTLSVHITVESDVGGDDRRGVDKTSGTTTDCYKNTSVLLPIILLAALLLVSMVMTFFFCIKVTRSQEQQKMGPNNMSYKS